jgi:hypothetical protein
MNLLQASSHKRAAQRPRRPRFNGRAADARVFHAEWWQSKLERLCITDRAALHPVVRDLN